MKLESVLAKSQDGKIHHVDTSKFYTLNPKSKQQAIETYLASRNLTALSPVELAHQGYTLHEGHERRKLKRPPDWPPVQKFHLSHR